MRQKGHALTGLITVLALFAIAAWFVFQPQTPTPAEVETSESGEADLGPAVAPSESETAPEREEVATLPEDAIAVRVIDPAGRPVEHVVVAVGMRVPGQNTAIRLGTARSNGDGLAAVVLNHEYRLRRAPFPPNPELMIDAKLASLERVRVRRLLEDAQADETQLQLPEVRTLAIRVALPDGGKVDFPVSVQAEWARGNVPEEDRDWSKRRPESLPVEEDRAYLVCGLGVHLQLSAWDSQQLYGSGWATEAGPTAADPPVVERELRLGELVPRFRARLLDENGAPYASTKFSHYSIQSRIPTEEYPNVDTKPESRWQSSFETDAEGRLDFTLVTNEYTQRFDRKWAFVLATKDRSKSLPGLDEAGAVQVVTALPRELAPGQVHDAGDLTLRLLAHPLIVSGRVVNREGNRAPAVVSVTTAEANWQERTRLWQGQPERDGSFTVYAAAPPEGEVIVSAGGFGHLGVEETVPVGTQDLELLMVKGNTLRGRPILPDGMPFFEMEIRMPGGRSKEVFPGGTFAVDYLRPAAESWVSLEHNGRELWRSAPIVIEGEGDAQFRPPQVQEVDLRGTMRNWSFRAVDTDGTPFEKYASITVRTREHGSNYVRIQEDGAFNQVLPMDVIEVGLHARGFEPVLLSWPPPAQLAFERKSVK